MNLRFRISVVAALLLLPAALTALPVPVFHAAMDDVATSTPSGGTLLGSAPSYVPGAVGNKFMSTGDSRVWWGWQQFDTSLSPIPSGAYDNGITVDLYFSGIDLASHSGISGLWSIGRNTTAQRFFIVAMQDDMIRINMRRDGTGPGEGLTHTIEIHNGSLPNGGVIASETYRLTVRQHPILSGGDMQVYLGGGGFAMDTLIGTLPITDGFTWARPPASDNAGMCIGNKWPWTTSTSYLKNGMAIDDVKVFAGYHLPSEIGGPVPEPATLALLVLAAIPLCRRRH